MFFSDCLVSDVLEFGGERPERERKNVRHLVSRQRMRGVCTGPDLRNGGQPVEIANRMVRNDSSMAADES